MIGKDEGGPAGRPLPASEGRDQLSLPGLGQLLRPSLAPGLELIGEYQGSGLEEPVFLVRRADGQMIQVSKLLFTLTEQIDGSRDLDELALAVGRALDRELCSDDVAFLLQRKLQPAGLVLPPDGDPLPLTRPDPLFGLRFRLAVLPESAVGKIAGFFWPLFSWPVMLATALGVVLVDFWLFFQHGVAQGVREVLSAPELMLPMLALLVLSTAFHEFGHASGCRYGGGRPGPIGVGLYLAWPVFYSDVTDSYRLSRWGRLRTDLGGVYFNLLFTLALAGAYWLTRFEPLLVLVALVQVEALHQFLPFFRLDGYYVISDLIGVPDLFARMWPALFSLAPWRRPDSRVADLKPWTRAAVSAWMLLTLAFVGFFYFLLVIGAPRIAATAQQSFSSHALAASAAIRNGSLPSAVLNVLQEVLLVLPLAAITLSLAQVGRALVRVGWRLSGRHRLTRTAFAFAVTAAVCLGAGYVIGGHLYRPIQPWEKGTLPVVAGVSQPPAPAPESPVGGGSNAAAGGSHQPARSAPASGPAPAPSSSPGSAVPTAAPSASPVPTSSPSPSPSPSTSPAPQPSPAPSPSPSP